MISEGRYIQFFYLNTYNCNCKSSYNQYSSTAAAIWGDLQAGESR